jgi:transposase
MTKGKLTDPMIQQQVLTYVNLGKKSEWIMKTLGLKKSTFYDIVKMGKVRKENEYKNKPGPKKKVNKVQMIRIQKDLEKKPRQSLRKLRSTHKLATSNATLSRVLRSIGIDRRKMKKRPKMTQEHMEKRVDFALRHCHPEFDWSKWIWTDEKKFNLDGPDGYNYYWHTPGSPPLYFSKDASAKKYVMVWGGISKNGQTKLMKVVGRFNAQRYCEMLEEGLLPSYDDGDIFLQDRASCHTARETKLWLKKNNVEMVYNPTKSPDLSPIENAWSWMAHEVYADKPAYQNVQDLEIAIRAAWDKMPQEYIDRLIDSMPSRMKQVIERKGEYIDY